MVGVEPAGIVSFVESPQPFVRESNSANIACIVSRCNPMDCLINAIGKVPFSHLGMGSFAVGRSGRNPQGVSLSGGFRCCRT